MSGFLQAGSETSLEGILRKLHTQLKENHQVQYALPVADQLLPLDSYLGYHIQLEWLGHIECIHCSRTTKKSFNQGYCYPCFIKLAQCDKCIMKPELCHYHEGTCREPDWGEQFCMTDHIVYLANSSGIKVGITRATQVPTRWIDQGAIQAVPIFRVATRRLSGLVEDLFRQKVSDRTNWRAMLKGDVEQIDLMAIRQQLFSELSIPIEQLQQAHGINAIQPLNDVQATQLDYPVRTYPTKITSFNFDKQALVEGRLMGIKGQYLILDSGVINIRKFTGYHISVQIRK